MVNFVAILVATLANFILGWLWYSPALFGDKWMKLNGFKKSDFKKSDMNKGMLTSLVTSLIMAYVIARLQGAVGVADAGGALVLGLWLWLGFMLPGQYSGVVYEKYKKGLFCIHTGYSLVGILLVSAILAMWK